jgi:cytidylate kinase
VTLSKRSDTRLGLQLARWEKASRAPRQQACVAIASLPGSGGDLLGQQVAERLGFACFGREIVDQIAAQRGLSEELLHGLDGRVRSAIDRYFTDFFQGARFTEDDFLHAVERFVVPLARSGAAVFVGRGTAFLFTDEPVLRVLAVAPFAARAERWAQQQGIASDVAADELRAEDERRFEFIRHHFGARLDDPTAYDLVVNTSTLGAEVAADLVVEACRRRHPGI